MLRLGSGCWDGRSARDIRAYGGPYVCTDFVYDSPTNNNQTLIATHYTANTLAFGSVNSKTLNGVAFDKTNCTTNCKPH